MMFISIIMIWSLFTRTCKQINVINKHWYRFYHSNHTKVFIPMPIKNFEFKSFEEFLSNAGEKDINMFYEKINAKTGHIFRDGDPIYIKTCDLDGKKNTHIQISNRPLKISYRSDIY